MQKHKGSALLFIALLILSVFAYGCIKQMALQETKSEIIHPKDVKREIILSNAQNVIAVYFATADGKNLVPITLEVNPTQEMAKVATEKLLAGPSDENLKNATPEGTKLKDLYKFDGIAYVDLTPEFLNATINSEANMAVNALVLTLTEFTQVDSVQILINGKIPEKGYGDMDISKVLKRTPKINFYGAAANGENLFSVYYSDKNAIYMVPMTFSSEEKPTLNVVIEKLLTDPPKNSNLVRPIWQGTKLLSIDRKADVVYVNLSKEVIAYGGGSVNEFSLVNALILTLTQIEGIKKVQLLIEGKKPQSLPEGTDVGTPWERPANINYIPKL